MIRNVFLIKSPLQLLNAMEACHHFGLSSDECLLLNLSDRKSRGQVSAMIAHSGMWPFSLFVSELPLLHSKLDGQKRLGLSMLRSRTLAFRRLSKLAQSLKQVERIFLGDYRNLPMRHFANVLPHRETILLDDGTATLLIADSRLKGRDQHHAARLGKRVKGYLKERLLGMRGGELPELTFFTAYAFQTLATDRLVPNTFASLRQSLKEGRGEEIFFLGSPLTEAEILSEEMHLAQLAAVRDRFAGERLIYVAHRRETPDWLRRVAELGVEIRHFTFPIEYQIAMVGPRPRVLASFISTALGNGQMIFGDSLEIIAFRMPPGTYDKREAVDRIYDHYKSLASAHFVVEPLKIPLH